MNFFLIYITTFDSCKKKNIKESFFAIEYPNEMSVNYLDGIGGHVQFNFMNDDSVINEQLTVGSSGLNLNSKGYSYSYMKKLVNIYKSNVPRNCDFNIEMVGVSKFFGQSVDMFKARISYPDSIEGPYKGDYLLMNLLIFPSDDERLDAVLLSLGAHDSSEIKSFDDFETKGYISTMVKSFRYIE